MVLVLDPANDNYQPFSEPRSLPETNSCFGNDPRRTSEPPGEIQIQVGVSGFTTFRIPWDQPSHGLAAPSKEAESRG